MTHNRKHVLTATIIAAIILVLAFAVRYAHKTFATNINAIEETSYTDTMEQTTDVTPADYPAHDPDVESNPLYYARSAPNISDQDDVWRNRHVDPDSFELWLVESGAQLRGWDYYWYVDNEYRGKTLMQYNYLSGWICSYDTDSKTWNTVENIHVPTLDRKSIYRPYYMGENSDVWYRGVLELSFENETANNPGVVHLRHYSIGAKIGKDTEESWSQNADYATFPASETVKFAPGSDPLMLPSEVDLWVGGHQIVRVTEQSVEPVIETSNIIHRSQDTFVALSGSGELIETSEICDGTARTTTFERHTLQENVKEFDGYFFRKEDGSVGDINGNFFRGVKTLNEANKAIQKLQEEYWETRDGNTRTEIALQFSAQYDVPVDDVIEIYSRPLPDDETYSFDTINFDGSKKE